MTHEIDMGCKLFWQVHSNAVTIVLLGTKLVHDKGMKKEMANVETGLVERVYKCYCRVTSVCNVFVDPFDVELCHSIAEPFDVGGGKS